MSHYLFWLITYFFISVSLPISLLLAVHFCLTLSPSVSLSLDLTLLNFPFFIGSFQSILPLSLSLYHSLFQGHGFSGSSSVSVPKGTTVMYVVQFRGIQVGLSEGTLLLKNTRSVEDSFEYR